MAAGALDDVRAELCWYFQSADAAVGISAAPFNPNKIGGVWDEAASVRAHFRFRDHIQRAAMAKRARIEWTLWGLPVPAQTILRDAFTPFGAGRASYSLQGAMTRGGVCLLAVALTRPEVAEACRAAHGIEAHVLITGGMIVRWLEADVRASKRHTTRVAQMADVITSGAQETYGARMRVRVDGEKAERAAMIAHVARRYDRVMRGAL